ncbi:MAG TPA: co-chaperone GroES [Candidatus Woesearchaeota archaeon]|nr:co-chaperone GroES [Candidatus Woesearchaeota archaeon]
MNIKPIGERVLIKHAKQEEKTKGGIYIPETAKEEKKEGEVIAVGQYKDGKELPLKKGDKVIYGGYSSDEITVDKEKYVFVDFKDILAKIE